MEISISTHKGWLSLLLMAYVTESYSVVYFRIADAPNALIAIEQGSLSFAKSADAQCALAFLFACGISEAEMRAALMQPTCSSAPQELAVIFSQNQKAIYDAIIASPWFSELESAAEQITTEGGLY